MIQAQTQTTIEDLLANGFQIKDGYLSFSYQKGELGCNLLLSAPWVHWNLNIHDIHVDGAIEYYFDRTKQMLSRPLSAHCQQLFSELEQKYPRYHRFSQLDEVLEIKTKLMKIVEGHYEQ